MAVKETQPKRKNPNTPEKKSIIFPFTRENYILMIIGIVVILIGYVLMIGGKSPDPNEFYPDQVYSFRRVTLAPIVIIIGVLVEIYAILKKPKKEPNKEL